jgi:colanic acid biosynthesis glycosyl transferase WcaI
MHIRFLHAFFYPDQSSVSQIISDLAFSLVRNGHTVDAIASRGTYDGKGKVLHASETVDGVKIRRIWSPNKGKGSIFSRLADLTSYTLGSFWAALTSKRADRVVVLTNPPMYAAIGILLKLLRRQNYIFVVMDLYPDIAVRAGMLSDRGFVTRIMTRVTRKTLKMAHRVVVLGSCMADAVAAYGVPRDRIDIIQNWADENAIQPMPASENPLRTEMGLQDRFVVMYSGNMGVSHRFEDLLEAAKRLQDRKDVCFLFVGGGARQHEIEQFVSENALENVIFRGYFPREQLVNSLALGDAHFVSLREGFEGLVVPSKAYGIMAAGRPMIYQGSENGEIASMIRKEGGGVVVPEGDPDAIELSILTWANDRRLAEEEGQTAREVFDRKYTTEVGFAKYLEVLES